MDAAMMLTIIREKQPEKLIRMGHAPVVLQPEPKQEPVVEQVQAPPAAKPERQRGRSKKMADKKLDQESGGPEVIRQDDAGEKGAIGSHGENAPAQEKGGSETDKGSKEGE